MISEGLAAAMIGPKMFARPRFVPSRPTHLDSNDTTMTTLTVESPVASNAATASKPDFGPDEFEIMCSAINIARQHQVQRLDTLRKLLLEHFPGRGASIEVALARWASRVAEQERLERSQACT